MGSCTVTGIVVGVEVTVQAGLCIYCTDRVKMCIEQKSGNFAFVGIARFGNSLAYG